MRFVDVNSGDIVYQVELPKAIYCLKIVQDHWLITAGQGNKISLWDAEKLKKSREEIREGHSLEAEYFPIMQLDLLREMQGPVGYSTYALEVINLEVSFKPLSKSSDLDCVPQPSESSVNLLLTGGRAKTIDLWDLETGENILSIPTPREAVIHSLAYHLLEQTFKADSEKKTYAHLTAEKLKMASKDRSGGLRSAKSLIRIFAGADNGSIYCWDIACNTTRAVVVQPNLTSTHELSTVTTINCEINTRSDRHHVNNDGDAITKLGGYQGVFDGHHNIVSTLLLLNPPHTKSTELNVNSEEQSHFPVGKSSHQRPILVSTSKDNSDVRLWHADHPFSSRVHSSETRNEKSSLICQLKNGHTRAIKTLGATLHPQQQSRTFRGMNLFVEDSINDIDVIRKRGEAIYDLLTCGIDNKVCVWDVCQILKDLKWQKIRWFVLLAKQISNIGTHRFDNENSTVSISAGTSEGSPSIFQNSIKAAGSKSTNAGTRVKASAGHQDGLAKFKFIFLKISYRIDILSAVGSFLA